MWHDFLSLVKSGPSGFLTNIDNKNWHALHLQRYNRGRVLFGSQIKKTTFLKLLCEENRVVAPWSPNFHKTKRMKSAR